MSPAAGDRRRHARFKPHDLLSNLGPVIDLSRSGMRVLCRGRIKGTLPVVIFNRDGPHLEMRARVAWTERVGFRRHFAGLEFIDVAPHVARELARIATAS